MKRSFNGGEANIVVEGTYKLSGIQKNVTSTSYLWETDKPDKIIRTTTKMTQNTE